jgi:hypothetical protein
MLFLPYSQPAWIQVKNMSEEMIGIDLISQWEEFLNLIILENDHKTSVSQRCQTLTGLK